MVLRDRPFNLNGGGAMFFFLGGGGDFCQQIFLKKTSFLRKKTIVKLSRKRNSAALRNELFVFDSDQVLSRTCAISYCRLAELYLLLICFKS